jgi:predicted TIM-barrel fold metal-dependent hydrolase
MNIPIIDTHQHLWNLEQFPYSWTSGNPVLGRSFLMSDYLAAIEGLYVVGSVHVEADVDAPYRLQETETLAALAREENPLRGLVAGARPEEEGFVAELKTLAAIPEVKGIRRILHVLPDGYGIQPRFVQNIQRLAEYDLSFDLCVKATQLPDAIHLAKAAPEVRFVLDHCGVPDVKGRALDPWRDYMREIASLPNVVGKISGVVAYADPDRWTAVDLAPFVLHTIDCFGWDRVMFGSDWPVCTLSATLRQWVGALREIVAGATEDQQRRLFHDNAVRVYRLKGSGSD